MCGIGGIFRMDGGAPDEAWLRRIGAAMRHRGPDEEGVYLHESFGMVHRRLSIIDLSSGSQPIFNEDRTVVTILNGEIYNYRELRSDLEEKGHRFSTNSDTEVLVHLYEDAGNLDFLDVINGMFAFVIYDRQRRTVWLARDRTGKKPLYYYVDPHQFCFASELGALRQVPDLRLTLSSRSIDRFLRYNYIPSPDSIYAEVSKLPAAHVMKVSVGAVESRRYWRMPTPRPDRNRSYGETVDEFRVHLERAVRRRLVSDVPIGAFLSGGLDSTAVAALMRDQAGRAVSTFSIGFGGGSFDESEQALDVAKLISTDHHAETIAAIEADDIEDILARFGEPFGDGSSIPTYFLCRMARRNVTVALSGDGADEVLGGYSRYVASQYARQILRLPTWARAPLRLLDLLPEGTGYYGASFTKKLKLLAKFCERVSTDPLNVMPFAIDDGTRRTLYARSFQSLLDLDRGEDGVIEASRSHADLGLTEQMLWTDVETYLPDDIHVKVDTTSMANSLEVRCPFLDVELMEFAATVPIDFKIQGAITKRLLRDWLGRRFPQVARRPKHGFEAPIGEWINGTLRDRVDELFSSRTAASIFERSRLEELLRSHRTSRHDRSRPIWAAFVLLVWLERQGGATGGLSTG